MFKKQYCENCDEKIKSSYNFCPTCGIQLKEPSKEWGMLGKRDKKIHDNEMKLFSGGLSGGILNKMIGGAMKMIEKEMAKEMKSFNDTQPKTNMKLMINGKEINPMTLQPIKNNGQKKENTKILPIEFEKDNLEKWSKLKKEEPETKLKRIDDKVQYEMDVPEVTSIKDISIIKLEKGIEVKAIGKEKAYQKTIKIDMPLKKYTLLKGKLTLELDASM